VIQLVLHKKAGMNTSKPNKTMGMITGDVGLGVFSPEFVGYINKIAG